VVKARKYTAERCLAMGLNALSNSALTAPQLRATVNTDASAHAMLKSAYERLGLSARGYDRLLCVARTIADLDASEYVTDEHVAEAVQLRTLDRKYFN